MMHLGDLEGVSPSWHSHHEVGSLISLLVINILIRWVNVLKMQCNEFVYQILRDLWETMGIFPEGERAKEGAMKPVIHELLFSNSSSFW